MAKLVNRPRFLLSVLVTVVFSQLLGAGFVYDDLIIITGNPTIDSLSPAGIAEIFSRSYWYPHLEVDNLYRPVTILTHAIEHAIAGETPWFYHLTSILLHLLNVLLLHALLARFWPDHRWRALLGAAVFAVHPVVTEAVCNVTCRADVLVVTFVLLAGSVVTAERLDGRRRWWLPVLTVLSLFAKENGIVLLPAVALIHACWLDRNEERGPWTRIRRVFGAHRGMYGLSLAALVAGLVIRFQVLGQSAPTVIITPPELNILAYESTGVRMLTAVKILGLAAFKFLWPLPLSFDYGTATITPVRTPFAAGFLGALACWSLAIAWAWQRARREPLILTGLLIVLGALLPVSNLLLPITTIFNERLLYLPTVGLALLVASVPGEGWRRWWVPALLVVVTAAGFLSWRRTGDWHDVASITEATAAASPRSANALMGLAEWRAGQGDIAAQGDALQRAVAAFPTSPRANYALGQWYQRQNDPARAMVHYEVSLTDRPTQTSLKAAMKLGFLNATSGHEETAVTYYRRALAINPNEPGAHFNLALLLRNLGDPDWERHAAIAARLGRPVPARND